ncbi:flagellar hook-associated protein FlgK [Cognatishimia sp. WU-CL00825]|uniref:flagellar hook-associated protein FlgK n=1 Tax=Cognatishimia sp. WU-CL00825 TaxID=3127658 RepID=UPI00310C6D19
MSITGALNNALSGLTANARAAQVGASNLSNALTPGYGRRQLQVAARGYGTTGGVSVIGVNRLVDPATIADRRIAAADLAGASAQSAFYETLSRLLGEPGAAGSLDHRFTAFEDALITAASRPDLPERLTQVANTAQQLADQFQTISTGIQTQRERADAAINQMVDQLNTGLSQLSDLNGRIARTRNSPEDLLALQDARQQVIDDISKLVPVRVIARDHGVVALYTTGGGILIDGTAPELSFQPTPTIEPHMTFANGLLSGISLNGKALNITPNQGPLRGGALAAQIAIRDALAIDAQAQIDGLARELVDRFQDPALDSTLGATDPGLFTDAGLRFDSSDETGLSGRVSLNALVSPSGTNAMWRLRDGLQTGAPGATGNASLLQAKHAAMRAAKTPASSLFGSATLAINDLTGRVLTHFSAAQFASDNRQGFFAAQLSALETKEFALGVDTDQELQQLLLIEQSYAANARMIETIDGLIQTLIRI